MFPKHPHSLSTNNSILTCTCCGGVWSSTGSTPDLHVWLVWEGVNIYTSPSLKQPSPANSNCHPKRSSSFCSAATTYRAEISISFRKRRPRGMNCSTAKWEEGGGEGPACTGYIFTWQHTYNLRRCIPCRSQALTPKMAASFIHFTILPTMPLANWRVTGTWHNLVFLLHSLKQDSSPHKTKE